MAHGNPVRIGIIGLGRAGWGMHCEELAQYSDRFQIVAACDLIAGRRQQMAARYGCPVYADAAGLIRDPAVEVVDIATRSCDHVAHATAALKAGKHVFLEKPICLTHTQALKLERLAGLSKGDLYVRHNRRFEPMFTHIREIIASGILGTVHQITLRRGGFQRRDDWQTIKEFGGGQLLNWGPHIIDHALRFLGTPPTSMWSDLKKVAAVGDAEDHVHIVMRNAAGLVVDLAISGGRVIAEPEYIVCGSRGGLHSCGNDLHLRYLDPAQKLTRRRAKSSTPVGGFGSSDALVWRDETVAVAPQTEAGMTLIWKYLYEAIRGGRPFPIRLQEAVAVMDVVSRAKKGTIFA